MGGERIAVRTPLLSGLEPQAFWGHFDALTKIARPSRQEAAVSDHVRSWADQHGFGAGYMIAMWTAVVGVLFLPANGTQIAAAEADSTGATTLGKRVIDHSFQLPLQVARISTALVGIAIVAVFH